MNSVTRWFYDAQAWLDARGKGAWIAAMVVGFILFWPIGLALLMYMIFSNRMSCSARKWSHTGTRFRPHSRTGNTAFDSYKDATLRRLEDEQAAFHDFLERLRKAKDQSEFDQFMDERARKAREDAARKTGDDVIDGDPIPA